MTDNYKQKYEDLMKRCADFMQDFAQPSPYERGFRDGWEAGKKEFDRDKTYVPDTTKQSPIRTMDLQWPRDQQAWPPQTTNPWPPKVYQACGVCGIGGDINKAAMSFVCNNPQCPTRVTCVSTTGTAT